MLVVLAAALLAQARFPDQGSPVAVGRIEGADLAVKTSLNGGMEIDAGPTVVSSGSDVTVRSGSALLLLDGGGEISICGPAHFTMLKSGEAITVALDYGRVHPSLDAAEAVTIYTPLVVATPVSISRARLDSTVGLDRNGEMCILTSSGAMRIEPQFAGQSMLVPQGGMANLSGGQIELPRGDAASCACNYVRTINENPEASPASSPVASRQIAALSHPLQPEERKPEAAAPTPSPEPVYTVIMPPLSFDASSPAPPPDPSPETILLVREARMRPSVFYRGHVNPAPVRAAAIAAPASAPSISVDDHPGGSQPNFVSRVRNFFRKLTNRSPCAGSGCGS
jgi:hypothetical protein